MVSENGQFHMVVPNPEDEFTARAPRFPSHALAEVSLSRWNPFSRASAVLLDMSVTGYKIQFVEKVQFKPGVRFQLYVPLEPFGVSANGKLRLLAEVKWFDPKLMRSGGVFLQSTERDRLIIERILFSVMHQQVNRDAER